MSDEELAAADAEHAAWRREHPEDLPPVDPEDVSDSFADDLPCWYQMHRSRPKVEDQCASDEPEQAKLNRWMSRDTIRRLQELNPELYRIGDWPLRIVAFLRVRRRNDHGHIPFGSADLHRHFGLRDSGHLNLGKEVEKLRAAGFVIMLSQPLPERSTDILTLEWPPEVKTIIDSHTKPEEPRADIITGKRKTRKQQLAMLAKLQQQAYERLEAVRRQEELKQYVRLLHDQRVQFTAEQRLMAEWYIECQWLLDRETETRNRAIRAVNTQIENIELLEGHQHYRIDKTRTPRIVPYGPNIGNLSRPLRWILLSDTLEFDLRYCHLAAFAAITGAPLLKAWLLRLCAEDKSAWTELMKEIKVPYTSLAKEGLKLVILELINGMENRKLFNVKMKLTRAMTNQFNRGARERFRKHPLIKEIATYRDQIYATIHDSGQATSPLTGKVFPLRRFINPKEQSKRPERVALSALMQLVETALLKSVRALCVAEAAKPEPRFRLKLHQHDGFSIKLRRTRELEAVTRALCQAVDADAAGLLGGVPTALECDAAKDKLASWMDERPAELEGPSRREHYERWKQAQDQG